MALDLLIRNTSEVLCVQGEIGDTPKKALTSISDGAVGTAQGRIAYLGPSASLPPDAIGPDTAIIDARGGFVGPGFIDAHTHLVFAGDREDEFALRCRGATYLEIARRGGGIQRTVRATRASSIEELVALARPRLCRLLEQGVTCAEVKSGYGLTLEDELKMLKAIRSLALDQPVTLIPTLLCAHAVPEERQATREGYLLLCVEEIIPAAAQAGLAKFCDAFVEEGAFSVAEARQILRAGCSAGLIPRLHTNQLTSSGGALLAAELHASSADHLEAISQSEIEALAAAQVVAVLMPTSTLFLKLPTSAPGRRLIEGGVKVALATNLNPGSAMSENVPLTLGLACLQNGLSPAEAYWAFTRGGAQALRLPEHGKLAVGGPADLVVFSCDSYRHLPYHFGVNHARWVVKGGRVVANNPALAECASSGPAIAGDI